MSADAPTLEGIGPGTSLAALPGVPEPRAAALAALGVGSVEDLLRHAPRRYEDRRRATPIAELAAGADAFVVARVERARTVRARGGLAIVEARLRDESGAVDARWFHRGYVPRAPAVGSRLAVYGAPRAERGALLLHAPASERLPDEGEAEGPGVFRLVPVHAAGRGVTPLFIRRLVWRLLGLADAVSDLVPAPHREELGLGPLRHALRELHFPSDEEAAARARRRLAFDELLVHDVAFRMRRRAVARRGAVACPVPPALDERIRARFPFTLTPAQDAVVAEIAADLARPLPMRRLLQGDVGAGKTAVAAYAALVAVAAGQQVAVVAPTEILARQHADTLTTWLEGSRVRVGWFGGGRRTAARLRELEALARGDVDLAVGTHALLQDDVRFARLGLAVVDEQHRFGVAQRRRLLAPRDDGRVPHLLAMSATPIPRTLAMAVHGDLDVSVLEGRLPGRRDVETHVVRPREGRRVLGRVEAAIDAGQQAYVIYPLVSESEALDLKDAEAAVERWRRALPRARVALLTGRMKRAEKDEVMTRFRAGQVDLLVATVVVEVGVDVPGATILVVEHAERFGLSQLHQLRGRVGRGDLPGLCVLVDRSRAGAPPARLEVLARTHDGLAIAEEDLALRGVGDLFGTRQSGRPAFRAAELPRDLALLARARQVAAGLLAQDPGLLAEEHRPLRRTALALVRRMTRA
ncbi:MAG: ATP-dependent DNA helicase RecG [Planctomycetota bacterium]